MTLFQQDVIQELKALQEFVPVPAKAFTLANDSKSINDYDHNGMKAEEVADLLISLSSIK